MNNLLKNHFLKSEKIILLGLVIIFILIRLPGTGLPLHQDEYKWPQITNPNLVSDTEIPHPPLSQFIYRTGGQVVGFNTNFRFIPLFFGTLNLLLLFYFLKKNFGKREAIIGSLIWIFSYFSILASLMVDTDGEVMPFFFLLSLIFYFKLKKENQTFGFEKKKYWYIAGLIISCVLGLFIKVSFILAVGAIILDYLYTQYKHKGIKIQDALKYLGFLVLGISGIVLLLFLSQKLFPFFSLRTSVTYWEHFFTGFSTRSWMQTAIQCVKALFYLSPFLLFIPTFSPRFVWERAKVFIFFLGLSFVFYILLFDFSLGALDRYLQLLVLPFSVMTSLVISKLSRESFHKVDGTYTNKNANRIKEYLLLGAAVSLIIFLLQFLPHYVPPLHPKSEWINRVLSLRWNFVYPFSGGSGPLGFYVSFFFLAVSWIVTFLVSVFTVYKAFINRNKSKANNKTNNALKIKILAMYFLLPLGIIYNLTFTEEYLFGKINGHAPELLKQAVEFIKENKDIKFVTTYNDNGGNEIKEIGKYRKRLYVDPKFDIKDKVTTLNTYKEHYFVLDVPRIDPSSIYQKYFNSCEIIYKKIDQKMSATIFDCRKAPDLKI